MEPQCFDRGAVNLTLENVLRHAEEMLDSFGPKELLSEQDYRRFYAIEELIPLLRECEVGPEELEQIARMLNFQQV
jgi:hypothetical protein